MQLEDQQRFLPGDLLEVKLKHGQMFTVFTEHGRICKLQDGMGLIVTHVYDDGSSKAEVHVMVLVRNGVRRVSFYDFDHDRERVALLERAP